MNYLVSKHKNKHQCLPIFEGFKFNSNSVCTILGDFVHETTTTTGRQHINVTQQALLYHVIVQKKLILYGGGMYEVKEGK